MTLEQVVDDVGTDENALFDTQKPCFQTLKGRSQRLKMAIWS